MLRGGSWNNDAANSRVANRNHNHPGNRNHNLGFRLAHTGICLLRDIYGCPARAHTRPAGRPASRSRRDQIHRAALP